MKNSTAKKTPTTKPLSQGDVVLIYFKEKIIGWDKVKFTTARFAELHKNSFSIKRIPVDGKYSLTSTYYGHKDYFVKRVASEEKAHVKVRTATLNAKRKIKEALPKAGLKTLQEILLLFNQPEPQ